MACRLDATVLGEAFNVSTATSATTGVAGRYASALFELADTAKSLDQVAQDLTARGWGPDVLEKE